ncbi:MAG: DUF4349 domain-containing protein [Terriglobales bacterium]
MQTLIETKKPDWRIHRSFLTAVVAIIVVLMLIAIAVPNLLRSRVASDQAARAGASRYQEQWMNTSGLNNSGPERGTQVVALVEPRRVVEAATMQIVASKPAEAAEQIAATARRAGGFVENLRILQQQNQTASAELTLRVPTPTFEEVKAEVRRLGIRVEHEDLHATDVTAQAVDLAATLRNYRAEEAQYLDIMRRAATVKDTLQVAERLGQVRLQIERTQAQANLLSRQTEMASLALSLRPDVAPVAPVVWSPMVSVRNAWRDSRQGFADFVDAMLVVVFYAPLVLAWALSLCGLAAVSWRIVRWVWKHWFAAVAPQTVAG